MKKPLPLMLALSAVVSICAANAPAYDFRKTTWGMTAAQVISSEKQAPVTTYSDTGRFVMIYPARVGDYDCQLVYIFAKNQLVRAKYLFTDTHKHNIAYISDFNELDQLLKQKYGDPLGPELVWGDRKTHETTDPQLLAKAVADGDLLLFGWWWPKGDRTWVIHSLDGGHPMEHFIEYSSRALESLENEVEQKGAAEKL